MNRTDFQTLARIRLDEAKILLDNGMYSGAYYLSGYAIECAIKACIAKKTNQHDFPPDRKAIDQIYSHKFMDLLGAANLKIQFENDIKRDKDLEVNWNIALPWNESSRYDIWSENMARGLYNAILDPVHGVLQWITQYW